MFNLYPIVPEYQKSHGVWLFDQSTGKKYLDFLSHYSSLPLGYNHEVFNENYWKEIRGLAHLKAANNLFNHTLAIELQILIGELSFSNHIHFCCTGALAVETALKCALCSHQGKRTQIASLTQSFHGINSWGFLTDNISIAKDRLEYVPRLEQFKSFTPDDLLTEIQKGELAAVLIEPIRSTAGDLYLTQDFFSTLRKICDLTNTCLIFDEVQTGFGATGTMWYYQQLDIVPDILVFGKKSQVSGLISGDKWKDPLYDKVMRLHVTFDGDLMDMLRAKYILKAYKENNLLQNARMIGQQFFLKLQEHGYHKPRSSGCLVAFDLEDAHEKSEFIKNSYLNGVLVNGGGIASIRLRPPLITTPKDIEEFFNKVGPYNARK